MSSILKSSPVARPSLSYQEVIEIIRNNIQWLKEYNSNQTKSRRNLLNKWFLDSIKNYFMEQHAAPLLIPVLKFNTTQQVKEQIHSNIDESIPKYMSILKNYFDLLLSYGKVNQFKQNLIDMLSINLEDFSCTTDQTNYIVQKTIRKQFVGLLVLTYCDIPNKFEINSFYDLWNIIFPNDKQTKMRLSKYDMLKENEKGAKNKNSSSKKMSKQKRCEAQQLDQDNFPFQQQQLFTLNSNIYTSPVSTFTSTTNLYPTNNNSSNNNNNSVNGLGYSVAVADEEEEEQHSLNSYSEEIFEKNYESAHLNTNLIQIPQNNISLISSNFQSQNTASVLSFPQSSIGNQQSAFQLNNFNNQNHLGQQQQQQQIILNKHQIKQINYQQINSQNCNSSQQLQQLGPSYNAQQQSISNSNLLSNQQQQSTSYQESQSQVTAQNLKSLEYLYSIQQNEQYPKESNQNIYVNDNHSSVSVNLNSEPEFFTSSSRLEEDFEQNEYIVNHAQEQYQNYQQQGFDSLEHQKYQINFNKKEEAYIIPVPAPVAEVQQYQEYPQYMNYQYQYYPSEQIDSYNLFNEHNQIINYAEDKEELVDSFFNRQIL
ncbi:hypothetical protein TTHERM_01021930 (macronuclear) [Tetrahymena thermophila SB210]|uniref:Uncharacterized protein n=1 Tax=Tetrahymena thermophila (strain SB210) TaxID=312017 RepID=Q22VD9_TETTS|nr:hypothetical protein TTHERM_01021930 [Tetrahymena thermophila SB210]EAR89226.1 hypothetical protein TTHERM_01021930 [Tetrahymena thermophila SB210]|eukprot:XP_001009471.1 hypothetical protein TTHERM_01021930 [Tetrahymena thermophila SB210]